MRRRTIIGAALLVAVGIVFGAFLVMSFNGVGTSLSFQSEKIKLGGAPPLVNTDMNLMSTQRAFVAVSKAVTPTVVSVTVTTKPKSSIPFFHNFQFNFPEPEPEQGMGSGVIVTSDGYIITNNHVVDDAEKNGIKITLHDNREFSGRVVGKDPTTDVAVIKIDANSLPIAALGNSDSIEVGEWVLAIGNPLGLTSTVTAGIVSALGRNIDVATSREKYGISNFIQTDAAINPGNSGGALVNIHGEVIGINAAIATRTGYNQGYGFAIPINLVKKMAEDLIAYGKVRRPWLGIAMKSDLDETDAHALGMSKPSGVLVQDVYPGTPAEKAGIKAGDVILSVDGKDVNAANEVQIIIAEHKPGDMVSVKVFRDGGAGEKKVTLSELPEQNLASADQNVDQDEEEENPNETGQINVAKLGISVQPLDEGTKRQANAESGILVASVAPNGPAADRTLLQGDIITEVDHQKIKSPGEFTSVLKNKKSGDAVMLRVLTRQGNSFVSRFVAVEIGE
ncbi:MAG TPA: Do family serine endopeptidase [Candidatus Acidoferrales bacterium]|nr:Do family serine endopeptidase [Candidatus Acidoferrales bacterium]